MEEECLYLGKVINIGAWMPGIRLIVQNAEGHYDSPTHTLMYQRHMLIYDPSRNFSEWVPMRGVSSSLTLVELRLANDLNNICPYPKSKGELTKTHSADLVYGRSVGEETDADSWNEPSDSEEWDKPEHGNWSCCSTPPVEEEGLTWEEITSESPQRHIATDRDDSDWDADEGTNTPAESQSQGTSEHSLPRKETLMEMLTEPPVVAPHDDMLAETAKGPGSQDVVQIHAGDNDLE